MRIALECIRHLKSAKKIMEKSQALFLIKPNERVQSEPANGIRVMLVDDHRIMLWALERLIESEKPRMEVVGKATAVAEALDLAGKSRPDVILLGLDLSAENGVDAIPELIAKLKAKVLVLTGLRDPSIQDDAVLAGARGVIGKKDAPEDILKAIEKVHQGELWLDRAATGRIFVELSRKGGPEETDPERQKIASLTVRERQIICTIVGDPGAIANTIAEKLHISGHTLRNHLTAIYEKLRVANRVELYVYANKHELRGRHDDLGHGQHHWRQRRGGALERHGSAGRNQRRADDRRYADDQ